LCRYYGFASEATSQPTVEVPFFLSYLFYLCAGISPWDFIENYKDFRLRYLKHLREQEYLSEVGRNQTITGVAGQTGVFHPLVRYCNTFILNTF
jgi:hypothetical protein